MSQTDEIAVKTERLRRMLAGEKLGGVLISAQHNFSWMTAGGTNGIDLSRDAGAAAVLVRADGKRFLLANRIEMPRLLAEQVSERDFEPIEFAWEAEKSEPDFLVRRAMELLTETKTIGADLSEGCSNVETALMRCRAQLTTEEVERYRALGRDAGAAIGSLERSIKPGITERQVARLASDSLAMRNVHAVVALVAADERIQTYRHPLATDRRWQNVLMIVVCARRAGLIASLTRIVCAGLLPAELERRTRLTAEVNARLYFATRPGVSGSELYDVAARSYAAAGFPGEEHLHHQGGACGYRTREWVAHPKCTETVMDHQAFAWNPSISGTKVEETVIVFGDRVEIITSSPDWPTIEVNIEGQRYLSPGVLLL